MNLPLYTVFHYSMSQSHALVSKFDIERRKGDYVHR